MKACWGVPCRIWIISLCVLVVPVLTDSVLDEAIESLLDSHAIEMIWLITLLPSFLFSYHKGLQGGIAIGAAALLVNLFNFLLEVWQREALDVHDINILIMTIFLHISIVISVGLLANALKAKEQELRRINAILEELCAADELTGILNRRGFLHISEERLRAYPGSACLYIDLNDFKPINDRYGHDTGDEVLKIVAKRLRSCIREEDIVGRIGGDEFVCLLVNSGPHNTGQIAARIAAALSEPMTIGGHILHISPSIGMAIAPHDGTSMPELLQHADAAMYEVKRAQKLKLS